MNILLKIQCLSSVDASWETYLRIFEDLPTLIETELLDRTWITDAPEDVLLGSDEDPLYAITSRRRDFIRKLRQNSSFSHQAVSQWLRYYLGDVDYHPQEGTPEYITNADALYTKARLVMCEGLYQYVEWFSTTFSNPRVVWLTWEYLERFAALEALFSKRFTSLGERHFVGKAKLFKDFRIATEQQEKLEDNQEKPDYSHLESFLKSDPVSTFAEHDGLDKIVAILSPIEAACTECARLNSEFDRKYWLPYTRARRHFFNVFRKEKRYYVPLYGNDVE